MYALRYSELVVPLVKGMQEQQASIESQVKRPSSNCKSGSYDWNKVVENENDGWMKAAIPGAFVRSIHQEWIELDPCCTLRHGKGSCAHRDRRRRPELREFVASARRTYGGHENGADIRVRDDFLGALTDCDVNVVLMDINMPGTNGIDTVRAAKTARPEIQFLMLTILRTRHTSFKHCAQEQQATLLKSTTSEELEACTMISIKVARP
ncbi:MAG: response regulator [Flavobacteriales bacterium]|nr:response regulator [Flavobacteriales bacterium]